MLAAHCLSVIAALTALAAASPARGGDQTAPQVDFAALADEFLDSQGIERDGLTFSGLLAGDAFARVQLGGIDLHVLRSSLADADVAGEFRKLAALLIELQETWYGWRGAGSSSTAIAEDWETLGDWVEDWPARKLTRLAAGSHSLYDQLEASEQVRAAQADLREHTRLPQETAALIGEGHVIILAPTRRDFVQLAAVGGLLEPTHRKALWTEDTLRRAGVWVQWAEIVALEYPQDPLDPRDPLRALPMTACDRTELLQHVADRAAAILLRKEFNRSGIHFFEEALGTNLVIAVVGKDDLGAGEWMYEYRTAGSKTEAYETFVPGGSSQGGGLVARKAGPGMETFNASCDASRYRAGGGQDYFLDPLRDAQKLGAKLVARDHPLSKDKTAHFVLTAADGAGRIAISAPFLGEPALHKPLPADEYLREYEEMFRAYRSLFVHWLREHGADSAEDSAARFGELIAKQAARAGDTPSHAVFAEVYGVPMSAEDGSVESLEWRFLDWLSKAR